MIPLTATVGACLIAWGVAPQEDVAIETVDLIEVNHFFDEEGRPVFDQCLFYDWSPEASRFMVRAWRLVRHPSQLPRRDWARDAHVAVWQDGPVLRKVRALSVRETFTKYDPELIEREFLPKERRRDLMPALTECSAGR